MVAVVSVLSLLACFVNISDYPKGALLKSYKWIFFIPVVALLSTIFVSFERITTYVPYTENLTRLVKVEDEYGKTFYWNLLIDVDRFAYEEGGVEITSYAVNGIISPDDGRIIDVESYGYEPFGDKVSFTDWNVGEYGVEYTTIVNRQDVDVAMIDRVKSYGILSIVLDIGAIILALFALSRSVKQLKLWQSEDKQLRENKTMDN